MTPRNHREVVLLHHQLVAARLVPECEHSTPATTSQLFHIALSRLPAGDFPTENRVQLALIAVYKARQRFPHRIADRLAGYTAVIAKHLASDEYTADHRAKHKRCQERDLEPVRQSLLAEAKPHGSGAYTAQDAWLDAHELKARGLWSPTASSWDMVTQGLSASEAACRYGLSRVTTWRRYCNDMAKLREVERATP